MPAVVKKPFVYDEVTGKPRLLGSGETLETGADTLKQTVKAAESVAAGAPVSTSGVNEISETDATDAAESCAFLGLACEAGAAGVEIGVVTDGPLVLPTATWDLLTGDVGGLVAGDEYWVDPASPGDLIHGTPPQVIASTQYVIRVGHALATDTMMVTRPEVFAI